MLPGMDGFELCRRIRRDGGRTPILFLTARGRDEEQVRTAAGKLADFLASGAAKMDDPKPEVLGPAPAPIGKIRGIHRWQVLVRGKGGSARALVSAALAQKKALSLPSAVTLAVDVDPLDLL